MWTLLTSRDELAAAIEIDLRHRLKERVSSSLALSPSDQVTETGLALVKDAVRSIERLDVGQQF